jgi:5-methylcytosine-specific restriction enzyme A
MPLPESPFKEGEIYKRTDVQQIYGGSPRGGIAPSASYPYILIFSQPSGEKHGYADRWENDLVFSYTGEGQEGDMHFTRGNLALLEHKDKGKRVFLFREIYKAHYKFEGELEVEDFDFFPSYDKNGRDRTAIKFFLKKVHARLPYKIEHTPLSVVHDIHQQGLKDIPTITERRGLVTSRVGQGAYRKSVLLRWRYKCAVTNYSKKEILIASHIVPWKDATNQERLDVSNGILLTPTYDALFDKHLISFEDNGKIILSQSLENSKYHEIGVTGKERINNLSLENFGYLDRHRKILAS